MKHFEVEIPKGYEIDQEKSTFEKIVFKPVDPKPTWKDFGRVGGWYVGSDSEVVSSSYVKAGDLNKNTWPSKEEAEAALALSQLCQWRDKYNEGWKPDWTNSKQNKHVIVFDKGCFMVGVNRLTSYPLAFKSSEIRDKFLEDFRDLIEIAKPLL